MLHFCFYACMETVHEKDIVTYLQGYLRAVASVQIHHAGIQAFPVPISVEVEDFVSGYVVDKDDTGAVAVQFKLQLLMAGAVFLHAIQVHIGILIIDPIAGNDQVDEYVLIHFGFLRSVCPDPIQASPVGQAGIIDPAVCRLDIQ